VLQENEQDLRKENESQRQLIKAPSDRIEDLLQQISALQTQVTEAVGNYAQ
jgi:hypothetical protein